MGSPCTALAPVPQPVEADGTTQAVAINQAILLMNIYLATRPVRGNTAPHGGAYPRSIAVGAEDLAPGSDPDGPPVGRVHGVLDELHRAVDFTVIKSTK
jgi:hypothetical protein